MSKKNILASVLALILASGVAMTADAAGKKHKGNSEAEKACKAEFPNSKDDFRKCMKEKKAQAKH